MTFISEERKKIIMDELDAMGKVHVISLAERLQVSNETIRRDLDALEEQGKLKRVYGGAVKTSYQEGEPPYRMRQILNLQAKQAIGRQALQLIKDGDTIFMDVGTTVLELARLIAGRKKLSIVTNSLPVANLLTDTIYQGLISGQIILLGGVITPDQQSVSGFHCQEMLKNFYVDKAFISVGGISRLAGISDYDIQESMISRMAIESSKEVIVLADHSKIGIEAFCHIAPLDAADVIISDQEQPPAWTQDLKAKGITWLKAD